MSRFRLPEFIANLTARPLQGAVARRAVIQDPKLRQIGTDLTLEEGKDAARLVGLGLLASVRRELGSLDRVVRVIKTLALVNSSDDFTQQPQVVNGYSELFAEIFGPDAGVGARSALATNTLPGNIPVEIEVILEIKD